MADILTDAELEDSRWVTLNKACAELDMSERQVRRWAVSRKITTGKTSDGRVMVNLDSVPEADEATLLEAAVSLAREQRKSCVELFTLYKAGIEHNYEAMSGENKELRGYNKAIEKELRRANKAVEELGDGAVARELAVSEHERGERRWDVAVTALVSVLAEKLHLDEKTVTAALGGLLPQPDGANGDAAPEASDTAQEPNVPVSDADA